MGYTSIKQALDRIEITGISQTMVIGDWVWQGKAAANWATEGAAAKLKREEVRTKKGTLRTAGNAADNSLETLHRLTVQGLGMARSKYRDDPGIIHSLSLLEAGGHERMNSLLQALARLSRAA